MMHPLLTAAPQTQTRFFPGMLLLNFCFLPAAARSHAPAVCVWFLEHGGDIVSGDISSDMLVDSRFCYLVANFTSTSPSEMGDAAGDPSLETIPKLWLAPSSSDSVVYAGWQSSLQRANRHKYGVPQPEIVAKLTANTLLAFVYQHVGKLEQNHALSMGISDQSGLRFDAIKLREMLVRWDIVSDFTIYSSAYTSALTDHSQNFVMPFFSKDLCFTTPCH